VGAGGLTGTWYIMPTAFLADGTLDLASQRALTEAVIDWGADGVTVLGVMGEASALDTAERSAVIGVLIPVSVLAECLRAARTDVVRAWHQERTAAAARRPRVRHDADRRAAVRPAAGRTRRSARRAPPGAGGQAPHPVNLS
jgi:hypothetical protein